MGLLDFQDEVDDFAFSNFDSATPQSVSSPPTTESQKMDYFPVCSSASNSMESVTTNASTASTSSTSSPRKSSKSPRRSKNVLAVPQRPRAKSFDLFGEDEELQEAEPTMHFCEICLKDCNTHR